MTSRISGVLGLVHHAETSLKRGEIDAALEALADASAHLQAIELDHELLAGRADAQLYKIRVALAASSTVEPNLKGIYLSIARASLDELQRQADEARRVLVAAEAELTRVTG